MKHKPMEEILSQQWGLKNADDITNKIFEHYSKDDTLKDIIDAEKLVVCSYALGKILASKEVRLKPAQLRRFYESLLTIRVAVNVIRNKKNAKQIFVSDLLPEIFALKSQLANAQAKQRREITPLFKVVNPLIDLVKEIKDFDRLCKFIESIVAYHQYCGGRD